MKVKVLKLYPVEEVGPDKKKKRDLIVADSSAAVRTVLWEEHIDDLKEGESYHLKNFYIKAKKHLSMPKQDAVISKIPAIETSVSIPTEDCHNEYKKMSRLLVCHIWSFINPMSCSS